MMLWEVAWFIGIIILFIITIISTDMFFREDKYMLTSAISMGLSISFVIVSLIFFFDSLDWSWVVDFWTTEITEAHIGIASLVIVSTFTILAFLFIIVIPWLKERPERPTCTKCNIQCRRKDTHCFKCGRSL